MSTEPTLFETVEELEAEVAEQQTGGKRRVILNTIYMGGAQVVSLLVSLIAFPLFLKHYGTSIYGLFLLVSAVVSTITVFDFGVTSIITKETAHHLALGDESALSRTTVAAFEFYALLSVVGAAILVLIGLNTHALFRVTQVQAELLRLMFFAQAGVQLLTFVTAPARQVLAGFQRYGMLALCNVLSVIGSTLAIVVVLVSGRGPLVLVALSGLASLVVALAFLLALLRAVPRHSLSFRHIPRLEIRKLLRLGFPLFLIQITSFLVMQQSDKLVLGVFLSAAALSLYEMPSKLFSLAQQALNTSVGTILPYISGLTARGEHKRVQNTFVYGSRYLSLLLCPALALLFIGAPSFISLWVGSQYAAVGTVARLLLVIPMFWPVMSIGDSVLVSMDKMGKWMPYAMTSGLLGLGLSLLLVRPWGLIGVASASFVAALCEFASFIWVVLRTARIDVKAWLSAAVVPGLCAIALSCGLFLLANWVLPVSSLWSLAALCVGILVVVWLIIGVVFTDQAERKMIWHWVSKSEES